MVDTMEKPNKITIWPAYIDLDKTQKEGRKISKENAVSNPKIQEINKAAKKLNLEPEVKRDVAYPKSWWENSGKVLISLNDSLTKREALIKISNIIKVARNK